jgi:hypothetical protein
MVLVGNTDDIFSDSGQNFNEDIHLPAQAASVTHRIAFGPNTGQPAPDSCLIAAIATIGRE